LAIGLRVHRNAFQVRQHGKGKATPLLRTHPCRPFRQSRQHRVVVVTVTQSGVANGMRTPCLAGRVVRI